MSQAMNTRVQSVALLRSIFFLLLQVVWCANSSCVPCQSYAVEVTHAGPADCEEREADARENSGWCRTTGITGGHPLGWLQSCFPNAKVMYESHTEESTEECMEFQECPETESACIAEVSDHIPAEDRNAVDTIVFMPECKVNRLHFVLRHGRKDFGKVMLSHNGEHYQEVEEAPEQCYDYREAHSVPEWVYILPAIVIGVLCIIGCCTICGPLGCLVYCLHKNQKIQQETQQAVDQFQQQSLPAVVGMPVVAREHLTVQVPAGVGPGAILQVPISSGQQIQVVVPEGFSADQILQFKMPEEA